MLVVFMFRIFVDSEHFIIDVAALWRDVECDTETRR